MLTRTLTEEQKNTWALAAMAAPAIHLGAGLTIAEILAAGLAAMGIIWILGKWRLPGIIEAALCVAAAVNALFYMRDCWPGEENIRWILWMLLGLGLLQAYKGREETAWGSILLWWITAFLLGSVLLSSVWEIKPRQIEWIPKRWRYDKTLSLLLVLIVPAIGSGHYIRTERAGKGILIGLTASVCTAGVLGNYRADKAPLYALSRSVRMYGILDRMEALAWLGLMLGTYLYFAFLMSKVREKWKEKEK